MKKPSVLPILAATCLAGSTSLRAATTTALIDFGMNGTVPASSANQMTTSPGTWNNIALATVSAAGSISFADNGGGADVTSLVLLSTTNVSTGWTISFSKVNAAGGIGTAGAGGNYNGTVGSDALAWFPTTASQDGIFVNNNATLRVTISGLDDMADYDLTAFTGRNTANANSAGIWNLVTGTATTSRFQDAAGTYTANTGQGVNSTGTNSGRAVEWWGVSPTGGTITFDVVTPGSLSNNVTDLNALAITQIPEPASAALLGGFAVLGLLLRRRN